MTWDEFQHAAIGTPFLAGGREFGGWDCWGCVLVAYREVLGIALSSYGDTRTDDRLAVARHMHHGATGGSEWHRVDAPAQMDVCVMRLPSGRRYGHVGLYDGHGSILHVEKGSHTAMERVTDPMIRNRVMGFWRHG